MSTADSFNSADELGSPYWLGETKAFEAKGDFNPSFLDMASGRLKLKRYKSVSLVLALASKAKEGSWVDLYKRAHLNSA